MANINLIRQKTDYFSQSLSQSPLEHYWSLSVEEQFYLAIPVLVLVAVSFHGLAIGKVKLWWERRIFLLLALVGFISFAWSLIQTRDNPQSAYFSTFTRAWEIGAGGMLAIFTFRNQHRFSRKVSNVISFASMTVILTSSFAIKGNSNFPGLIALIPVICTMLIIFFGGFHGGNVITRLLSLQPLVFIGEISYSLYLWHLPVFVIAGEETKTIKNVAVQKMFLTLIVLVLSILTFFLLEKPLRNKPIPETWQSTRRIKRTSHSTFSFFINSKILKLFAVIFCFALIYGEYNFFANSIYRKSVETKRNSVLQNNSLLSKNSEIQTENSDSHSSSPISADGNPAQIPLEPAQSDLAVVKTHNNYSEMLREWKSKIVDSLQEDSTKNLNPTFESSAGKDIWKNPDCKSVFSMTIISRTHGINPITPCLLIGGTKEAVFIGNSHARMLQTTVSKSLLEHGYTTYSLYIGSCGIAAVTPVVNGNPTQNCETFRLAIAQLIKSVKPSVVVISESNGPSSHSYLPAGITSIDKISRDSTGYWKAYSIALEKINKSVPKIIIIGETPRLPKNPTDCVGSDGIMLNSCNGNPTEIEEEVVQLRSIAAVRQANFLDSRDLLCVEKTCPVIIGKTLVYTDASHVSYAMSIQLTPLFSAYLTSIGL
jgi:hypothetical protein